MALAVSGAPACTPSRRARRRRTGTSGSPVLLQGNLPLFGPGVRSRLLEGSRRRSDAPHHGLGQDFRRGAVGRAERRSTIRDELGVRWNRTQGRWMRRSRVTRTQESRLAGTPHARAARSKGTVPPQRHRRLRASCAPRATRQRVSSCRWLNTPRTGKAFLHLPTHARPRVRATSRELPGRQSTMSVPGSHDRNAFEEV